MPNGFDFDFEKVYGQSFDTMTRGEKDAAILSQLHYLRCEARDTSKLCLAHEDRLDKVEKIQDKRSNYWKIAAYCGSAIFLTLLGLMVDILIRRGL